MLNKVCSQNLNFQNAATTSKNNKTNKNLLLRNNIDSFTRKNSKDITFGLGFYELDFNALEAYAYNEHTQKMLKMDKNAMLERAKELVKTYQDEYSKEFHIYFLQPILKALSDKEKQSELLKCYQSVKYLKHKHMLKKAQGGKVIPYQKPPIPEGIRELFAEVLNYRNFDKSTDAIVIGNNSDEARRLIRRSNINIKKLDGDKKYAERIYRTIKKMFFIKSDKVEGQLVFYVDNINYRIANHARTKNQS